MRVSSGPRASRLPGMFRNRTPPFSKLCRKRAPQPGCQSPLGRYRDPFATTRRGNRRMQSTAESEPPARKPHPEGSRRRCSQSRCSRGTEIAAAAKQARRELSNHTASLAVALASKQITVDSNTDQVLFVPSPRSSPVKATAERTAARHGFRDWNLRPRLRRGGDGQWASREGSAGRGARPARAARHQGVLQESDQLRRCWKIRPSGDRKRAVLDAITAGSERPGKSEFHGGLTITAAAVVQRNPETARAGIGDERQGLRKPSEHRSPAQRTGKADARREIAKGHRQESTSKVRAGRNAGGRSCSKVGKHDLHGS